MLKNTWYPLVANTKPKSLLFNNKPAPCPIRQAPSLHILLQFIIFFQSTYGIPGVSAS